MIEREIAEKNLILKIRVGSHLYGTSTPESDSDFLGIFIPPRDYVMGLKRCEQVELRTNPSGSGVRNTKVDSDTTLYSLTKFIHLALENNPNITETFFVNSSNIIFCNEYGQKLLDSYPLFISKRVKDKFVGYAISQEKKLLLKKDRLDAIRKCLTFITAEEQKFGANSVLKDLVKVEGEHNVYKTYEKGTQFGWIKEDLTKLADEYGLRTKQIDQYGFDLKFASHLIRLLTEGITLLKGHPLLFPLENWEVLKGIKLGQYKLEAILKQANVYKQQLEESFLTSPLPDLPNIEAINKLQISFLEDWWKTHE